MTVVRPLFVYSFGSLCLLLSFFLFSCSQSLSVYLFCGFSLPATPLPFQHIPSYLSLSTGSFSFLPLVSRACSSV